MFKLDNLTIEDIEKNDWLLYKVVSGSKAYGTNLPTSDIDIRGVFKLPTNLILQGYTIDQVQDKTNDTIYYELGRFIELLSKGNPNIIELLFIDKEHIMYCNHTFLKFYYYNTSFITIDYANSALGYSRSQIYKARGLNKKFVNPQDGIRKSMLHFCYIINKNGETKPLMDMWITSDKQLDEIEIDKFLNGYAKNFGVKQVSNGKGLYAIYPNTSDKFVMNGLLSEYKSTQFKLSSIPKDINIKPIIIWFNEDGFSVHCRKYKEYMEWGEKRNLDRYNHNSIVKYDSKNMMHCVRILMTLRDYLKSGVFQVKVRDLDTLMKIRNSKMEYEDILSLTEELNKDIQEYIHILSDKCINTDILKKNLLDFRNS